MLWWRPASSADAALVTALQEHVKREIAPYKYPRAIEFVAQLPKTETGKLRRFALAADGAGRSRLGRHGRGMNKLEVKEMCW